MRAKKATPFADAVSLATVDARGDPSVRTMILKAIDAQGFHFVTQARGPKAKHLTMHPMAELCAYWGHLGVQIRTRGRTIPMSATEIEKWWHVRERDAKILYHLGIPQSSKIPSYAFLLREMKKAGQRWTDVPSIPRSPWYVGYIIEPRWVEFFHHSPARLNRRERYVLRKGVWHKECLAP